MTNSVTWKIGGEAGFGIISSGNMISKVFARHGYNTLATNEYPSLIRGGHNVVTVRISSEKFYSLNTQVQILAALNKQTVELHKDELSDNAVIVFDPADFDWKSEHFTKPVRLIALPLKEMVRQKNADPVMRNTILLGATIALMGVEFSWVAEVITDQFKKKGEKVISYNVELAQLGFDHIKNNAGDYQDTYIEKIEGKEAQLVMNASESLALGAIRAGMKFAAIYPMTPINAVISFFADHAKQFGIVYKQPEDEIAGMNMAVGASYAGVRSMVATSGGGFALMVEAVSLAGIIEVPVVIDMGMRVGPATGMPTWTEQGELRFIIHAGHGEFAKIVLAPGDCEDCYTLTTKAFNLADKYQIPVFVLTDKYLNESQWCVRKAVYEAPVEINRGKLLKQSDLDNESDYKRYKIDVEDGISPRGLPGMKHGHFFSNAYEHDEHGQVTEEPKIRTAMAEKRLKKMAAIEHDVVGPVIHGDADADITFVTWGSTTGPVMEAKRMLEKDGKKTRVIQFQWMFPFPSEATKNALKDAKRTILVEQNGTAQLGSLIKEFAGIDITEKFLKFDGRPFYPEEIVKKI